MSFMFNWLDLSVLDIKQRINTLLATTSFNNLSPTSTPNKIELRSLTWGQNAPIFELLEIIELSETKFKGTFKFKYDGELNLVLNSNVEVNSLRLIDFDDFTKPHFILSDKSTILPVDFSIKDFKLDCLITVVYNSGNITVVFDDSINEGMFMDLNIRTSLDELLDDDLFQMIKNDTLEMATEFLKEDLPSMIHKLKLFGDEEEEDGQADKGVKEAKVLDHINTVYYNEVEFPTKKTPQLTFDIFNTLSLKPETFKDFVDRVSLSDHASQPHRKQKEPKKKRRTIKMKKITTQSRSATQSLHTPLHKAYEASEQEIPSVQLQASISTSPTLYEQNHYNTPISVNETTLNSIDDYLQTLEEPISPISKSFDHPFLDNLDPYESLIHPMDIPPAFDSSVDSSITENLLKPINEKLMRPRGPSSNYINLNEFKKCLEQKDELLNNGNSISVFDE